MVLLAFLLFLLNLLLLAVLLLLDFLLLRAFLLLLVFLLILVSLFWAWWLYILDCRMRRITLSDYRTMAAIELPEYLKSYWRIQDTIGLSDVGSRPQSIGLSDTGLRKNICYPPLCICYSWALS
jgi:hypothetical protein